MMIPIIYDKSTIQSLNELEIHFLHKYYTVNFIPVLLAEINGDLFNKNNPNNLLKDKVSLLASKLNSFNSSMNMYHEQLVIENLLGGELVMDFRPVVDSELRINQKGERIAYIKPTILDKYIQSWRVSEFRNEDIIAANEWQKTKQMDLENLKKLLKKKYIDFPKFKTLKTAKDYIDKLYDTNPRQLVILQEIISIWGITNPHSSDIILRWENGKFKYVKDFSPYAFYCYKVNILFYLGLINNLVSTRSTNFIDLQYLYYLPFSWVFTSGDKFHKSMAEVLLTKDQYFLDNKELKRDLYLMRMEWIMYDESQREEMWNKKYNVYPPKYTKSYKIQESYIKFVKNKNKFGDPDKGIDGIIHEKRVNINELCFCSSGKKFKDCHGKNA